MIGDDIKIVDKKYKFPIAPKFRWNCDRDIEIFTDLDSEESDWDREIAEAAAMANWDQAAPKPRKTRGRKSSKPA